MEIFHAYSTLKYTGSLKYQFWYFWNYICYTFLIDFKERYNILRFLEIVITLRGNREGFWWITKTKYRRVLSIYNRRIKQKFLKDTTKKMGLIQSNGLTISNVKIDKRIYRSSSQSGQDIFVQIVFPKKTKGNYLEIGSAWPIKLSNTFVLENTYKWKGLSIDLDAKMVEMFNKIRKNKSYCYNGTTLNYRSFIKREGFKNSFEYLSMDIDPSYQSYFALKKIMSDNIKFLTLTFEHDRYRSGPWVQIMSSSMLRNSDYIRVAKNIKGEGFGKYEDWWILKPYFGDDRTSEIIYKIKSMRRSLKI